MREPDEDDGFSLEVAVGLVVTAVVVVATTVVVVETAGFVVETTVDVDGAAVVVVGVDGLELRLLAAAGDWSMI